MSTQTFDLHLRFTVSIDVGEATVTPVLEESADPVKGPTLVQPTPTATARPARTTRPRTTPAVAPPPDEGKDPGKSDDGKGDNNVEPAAPGAGGPP